MSDQPTNYNELSAVIIIISICSINIQIITLTYIVIKKLCHISGNHCTKATIGIRFTNLHSHKISSTAYSLPTTFKVYYKILSRNNGTMLRFQVFVMACIQLSGFFLFYTLNSDNT